MTTDNKQIIETAMKDLFVLGDVDAAARHLRDDFVDHGPGIVTASRAGWVDAVRKLPVGEMKLEVRRVLADGPYVIMLSRRWLPWEQRWIAVFDLWRFEDGMIIEHGEVLQTIEDTGREVGADSLMPW